MVLAHSTDVAPGQAVRLLALMPGERVLVSARPNARAVSPDVVTGVDCKIPMTSGKAVRGIGTLSGRLALTGGRLLQSCVSARVEPGANGYRRAWSHYLSRLGVVETIGRAEPVSIAERHLVADRSASTLGMGGFAGRLLAAVRQSPLLDRRAPFRAGRTVLRWVVAPHPGWPAGSVRFTIEDDGVRTLWVVPEPEGTADVAALCADIALHDWLLTTLESMVERSRIGSGDPIDVVARLRPAVDHLLHQWMPGARLDAETGLRVWEALERKPGLSRQWEVQVGRIRDQIAMGAVLLHLKDASGAELFPGTHAR